MTGLVVLLPLVTLLTTAPNGQPSISIDKETGIPKSNRHNTPN